MNSRSKGARGEREWRDQLRAAGFEAIRGQQFAGGADSPDVRCPDLPRCHFEVKRVEALNVSKAIEQAIRDSGPEQMPVVAHKRNRGPWLVTMLADDWFQIVRESSLPRCGSQALLPDRIEVDPEPEARGIA